MLKKKFLKTKCKVTFELPGTVAELNDHVNLVGDFNDWDEHLTLMERTKSGQFSVMLDLPLNREFQFRYLVNGNEWHNDWNADSYQPNPFSGDNSVVNTHTSAE